MKSDFVILRIENTLLSKIMHRKYTGMCKTQPGWNIIINSCWSSQPSLSQAWISTTLNPFGLGGARLHRGASIVLPRLSYNVFRSSLGIGFGHLFGVDSPHDMKILRRPSWLTKVEDGHDVWATWIRPQVYNDHYTPGSFVIICSLVGLIV